MVQPLASAAGERGAHLEESQVAVALVETMQQQGDLEAGRRVWPDKKGPFFMLQLIIDLSCCRGIVL
jgi:hypothetical protein